MCAYNPGTRPPRRRRGCLSGCLPQILAALALAVVIALATYGLLAPWGFYLGGNTFHIDPEWRGWGRIHSDGLGDFALYVQLRPGFRGSRMYAHSNLAGDAWLCTPRGETFHMKLGGGMRPNLNANTNGEKISLYMNNWPVFGSFTADHRPSLNFRGQWQNPNLVLLDDHASLSSAFLSDGSVYRGHDPNRLPPKEIVQVILQPGSYRDFKSTCTTLAPVR
jgi:hypothetical protein